MTEPEVVEDTRPRVATSKRIDLALLAEELGAPLCEGDGVIVAAEGADVTQKQLESAVRAHVAPPEPVAEPPLTDDEIRRLRALLEVTP